MPGLLESGHLFFMALQAAVASPVFDRKILPFLLVARPMIAVHVATLLCSEIFRYIDDPRQQNEDHDPDYHQKWPPDVIFHRPPLSSKLIAAANFAEYLAKYWSFQREVNPLPGVGM
jgi:hypothetical protein